MDEAEKYKQRLEAIAEKRRLQEEQDKAKREMEDEKLRLQQLKRKSLRDQWLMEGAPLSPTSPDAQSPHSPLGGSKAQEMERRIDKLESESQRLAEEEEEKLKEQMEAGQSEAGKVVEMVPEIVQDAVLQNGDNNATGLENEENTDQSTPKGEVAAVLTNGQGEIEAIMDHKASGETNQPTTNGPVIEPKHVINVTLDSGLNQDEAENFPTEEEEDEDEGTMVMRAECVIITDEGEDVPEDLTPQEDQQETTDSEVPAVKPSLEGGEEGGEPVEENEEEVKTEAAPQNSAPSEHSEATAGTQPHGEARAEQGDDGTQESRSTAEGQDSPSEDPASAQVQCGEDALEGATVAPVPVYSEVPMSSLNPRLESEGETEEPTEAAVEAPQDQTAASQPSQFQEVSLADPQESPRTAEQEPLLSQAKAPDTQAEPTTANSPDSSDTNIPTRNVLGEETQAPKRKACQCCSVM